MFNNVFVTNALHTNISEHVFRIKCSYFKKKNERKIALSSIFANLTVWLNRRR